MMPQHYSHQRRAVATPAMRGLGVALPLNLLSPTITRAAADALRTPKSNFVYNPRTMGFDAGTFAKVFPRVLAEINIARAQPGLWDADKAWEANAAFADGRGKIICGGGGCNIPRCTFQFWNANDVPCTEQTMEAILSQIQRHTQALIFLDGVGDSLKKPVWTKERGKATPKVEFMPELGNPWYSTMLQMDRGGALPAIANAMQGLPLPLKALNQSQRDAVAIKAQQNMAKFFPATENWGNWVKSVLQGVAAARWATNIRWSQAVDGNWEKVCPHEWKALGNDDTGRTFFKFHHEDGDFPNYPPLMLAPKATAYEQMGEDEKFSWREDPRGRAAMYPRSRDGSGADRNPPLYGGTNKLPTSREDFSPQTMFFRRDQGSRANPLAYLEPQGYSVTMPIEFGPQASAWKLWPEAWGDAFNGDFEAQLNAWIDAGRSIEGSKKFVDGEYNGLPHPYYVLSWATAVLCDTMSIDFLALTSKAMSGFLLYYDKLPANMKTVKPSQMQAYVQALQKQSDDMVMGMVSQGLGVVTNIVIGVLIASNTVPVWGTIIGAVIAALVTLVGVLVAWRYDLGLDRIANPPCPVPPFVRMIPATAETAACDFDAERLPEANAAVKFKADVVRQAANAGIRPGTWVTILQDMERGGQQPQTPSQEPKSRTALYVGASVGVAALVFLFLR
jgi:hypothetical protein